MHALAALSALLLTLCLASIGAAGEPTHTTPMPSSEPQRELLEDLDRLGVELSEQLSRQLDDQLDAQSAAALSRGMAELQRGQAARRGTVVADVPEPAPTTPR